MVSLNLFHNITHSFSLLSLFLLRLEIFEQKYYVKEPACLYKLSKLVAKTYYDNSFWYA